MSEIRVLVVADTVPWPTSTGSRKRAARVAELLASTYEVTVAFPPIDPFDESECPTSVKVVPLTSWTRPSGLRRYGSWLFGSTPWDGRASVGQVLPELKQLIAESSPDVIYWCHSYVAATAMQVCRGSHLNLVEFTDIERSRLRSMTRAGNPVRRVIAAREYLRATRWEASVSAETDAAVAMADADRVFLAGEGPNVVLCRNGVEIAHYVPSSGARNILAVASWDYAPNADGLIAFVERDWPAVRAEYPDATLTVVGRDSQIVADPTWPGVSALGYVDDIDGLFDQCDVFLAPAQSGGGSQLKLGDAAAHGRAVVGPAFLQRERAGGLENFVIAAEQPAAAINRLLADGEERHRLEEAAWAYAAEHTWEAEGADLVEWVANATRVRSAS